MRFAGVLASGYDTANKLELNSQSDLNGGTSVKTTFLRSAADSISAVLKVSTMSHGVNVEGTSNGAGTITAKASMSEVVDGVTLTVDTSLAGGAKIADITTPTVTADYHKGDVAAKVSVAGTTLDASATFTSGDLAVGAASHYDSTSGTLSDPSIAASYSMGATGLTASMIGLTGDDIRATITHTVSDDLDVAATFASKDAKFSVGAGYTIDKDSSVKAKINSDGILNVGYARKLTAKAGLKAGLEVDTNNMDERKLGISMVLASA
jgi:CheY-specific phosphatase CheX